MRSLCFLLALLLPHSARAAEPVFVARSIAGKEFTGPLTAISADCAVELGKGGRHKVPAGELIELRLSNTPRPALPGDDHLILANGDRVPFRALRLDDEKVYFNHPDLADGMEISVPLSSVLLIWRLAPDRAAVPEKLRRSFLAGKRSRDVVLLRNGDRVVGTLNGIGKEVSVEVEKKAIKVKWPQVAAIAMSTELADRPKMPTRAARLVLTATQRSPGGRLTVTSPGLVEGEFQAKTTFGTTVRVPLDRVVSLSPIGGKAVPLSSLKPAKYEYRPYLDEDWPYAVSETITGRDLRVGGSVYEYGVGTHAHCLLTYNLDGKYRRFEALVGLDDIDGREGRVRLRVLADGKEIDIGHKGILSRQSGPWRVSGNVEGAKTLTLEVLPADNGPVQAVVNWVLGRLVQ